jgi:hypothetical protein
MSKVDDVNRFYVDERYGERAALGDLRETLVRIPDLITDCVCFLCVVDGGRVKHGGTAFFVGLRTESDPDYWYRYLVTAKHNVVQAQKEPGQLVLRMNTVEGGSRLVDLSHGEWLFPDDPGIDLALFSGAPSQSKYDFQILPADEGVATEIVIQDNGIGIGDDLIAVGLFTKRHGHKRNIPIVRAGIIASMSDEPLTDTDGNEYRGYLAEMRSLGGLSGSPVFATLHPGRRRVMPDGQVVLDSGSRSFLLGIIKGHWPISDDETASLDYVADDPQAIHSGIAVITPAQQLHDFLHREDLVKDRRRQEAERRKSEAAIDDSALNQGEDGEGLTREQFEDALRKVSQRGKASTPDEGKSGT